MVLNWRDTGNPEGGGSEVYVENLARRWATAGHEVTLVCASHGRSPREESHGSLRVLRTGTKLTVYSHARRLLRQGALGAVDVVVDTQNGVPFFAPLATAAPTVVLVHHVHREQWPVVYDPVRARIGTWIESTLAPWFYRGHEYVTVSNATRTELISHGVEPRDISVVHNGTDGIDPSGNSRDADPRILVLGRLVPHKRVEHVLAAGARLRTHHPRLSIAVVGDGWWADELHAASRRYGVEDLVEFTGHVSEDEKARQIDRAWVLALPSLKEGWGLVVMEAASRGVPAVAYVDAGGVGESISDGVTGMLVDGDVGAFTSALDTILSDARLRESMGGAAQQRAREFSWDESAQRFEEVLARAAESRSDQGPIVSWWNRRRRKADRP